MGDTRRNQDGAALTTYLPESGILQDLRLSHSALETGHFPVDSAAAAVGNTALDF